MSKVCVFYINTQGKTKTEVKSYIKKTRKQIAKNKGLKHITWLFIAAHDVITGVLTLA